MAVTEAANVRTSHPCWDEESRKEKAFSRYLISENAKKYSKFTPYPYRCAFELAGTDYIFTKNYLVHMMKGETLAEKYSRIHSAENKFRELAAKNNPGVVLHTRSALAALRSIKKTHHDLDFTWLDFCGAYGLETEQIVNLLFREFMISRNGLLYFTFNENTRGCNKDIINLVIKSMDRMRSKFEHRDLISAIPYHLTITAGSIGYGIKQIFRYSYQDFVSSRFNPIMHVFGFICFPLLVSKTAEKYAMHQVTYLDRINRKLRFQV